MNEPSGWVATWAGTRDLDGLVAAGLLANNMRPCSVCGSEPVGSWAVQYRCLMHDMGPVWSGNHVVR